MPSFFWKKKGYLAIDATLKKRVEQHMDRPLERAGLALQGGIQEEAPYISGTLRRSVNTGQPLWRGSIRRVPVGTRLVYAPIVNRRGRRAGYFKRGIDKRKGPAKQIIQGAAKDFAKSLWVSE